MSSVLEFDPRLNTHKRRRGRRPAIEQKPFSQQLAETIEDVCARVAAQEPDAGAEAGHLIGLLELSLKVITVSRRRAADLAKLDAAIDMSAEDPQ